MRSVVLFKRQIYIARGKSEARLVLPVPYSDD